MSRPAKIFISYCHADDDCRKRLDIYLAPLKYEGLIATWTDQLIMPGARWADDISKNLNSSDIIILLISADFIASYYCIEVEMKLALERHQRGEARIIPVFIRPADWSKMPFAVLQGLPKGAKPISCWSTPDEAWLEVAQGIRSVTEEIGRELAAPSASGKPPLPSEHASLMAGMRYAAWRGKGEEWLEQALRSYFDNLGISWKIVKSYCDRLDLPKYLLEELPASAQPIINWFDIGQLLTFLTMCDDACITDPKVRPHTFALFGQLREKLQIILLKHADSDTIQGDLKKLLTERAHKVEHFARIRERLLLIATGASAAAWYENTRHDT